MLIEVAVLNLRLSFSNCNNVLKDKPTTQFYFSVHHNSCGKVNLMGMMGISVVGMNIEQQTW
jgi:hypothetical protein